MIKHIFLDLGQVTVRLDMQKCIEAFTKLGINDVKEQISNSRQYGMFSAIELGTMSNADFFDNVRKIYGLKVTDQQITDAWNAFILDTPESLQQKVYDLHKKFHTYILSNTNQIHYDYWADVCMGTPNGHTVNECFDKCYLSNLLHLAKPDPAIYKAVLADAQAKPEECLYLDDNEANIAEAKSQGWNAEVIKTPEETLARLIKLETEGK